MLGPVCLFTGQASSRFTVWATSHIPTTRKPGLLGQRLLWSSRYQFPPTFSLCFQDLHSRCPKIQQSQVKLEVLILSSLFPNSSVTQSSYPPPPTLDKIRLSSCDTLTVFLTPTCSRLKTLVLVAFFSLWGSPFPLSSLWSLTDSLCFSYKNCIILPSLMPVTKHFAVPC